MRRSLKSGALAPTLCALAACGADEAELVAEKEVSPLPDQPLDLASQEARYQSCLELRQRHVESGLWERGGAQPMIRPSAWLRLDEIEKAQIVDIAGCIAQGGQVGKVNVTILSSVSGAELYLSSSANRSDFASLAK